jgi:Tol biopolymer transport system component
MRPGALSIVALAALLTGCSAPAAPADPVEVVSPVSPDAEFLYQWMTGGGEALWTMDAAGENPTKLGIDAEWTVHPDWSPDGQRLVFAVDREDGRRELWMAEADGSNVTVAVACDNECVGMDSPAWSPDGTRIAFAWYDEAALPDGPPASGSIRIVDLNTGATSTVTQTTAGEIPDMPRWAPSGDELVIELDSFDGLDFVTSRIATVAVDGGTPVPLTEPETMAQYPDWSPDGKLIVFCTFDISLFDSLPADAASNLFTIGADGGGLTQLTELEARGDRLTQPSWLLDGGGIIATYDHGGSRTAAVVPTAGGSPIPIGTTNATHTRERPRS